jgi:hypothetical protein
VKFILILLFLTPQQAQADDCYHCFWQNWNRWRPRIIEFFESPVNLVKVEKVDYPRNEHASYCTRPVEMLDTIVIHHSAGSSTATALEINSFHLNRGTAADPWHMIGYSYVINSPYAGSNEPTPKVTEGRPLNMVGSHAGSHAFVDMDEEQTLMWEEGRIVCGKIGETFRIDPNQIRNGKIKANITTLGLVVLGNYAPFARDNPAGYHPGNPRHPTKETLELTARISCQLQKKHPRIKYIKWHNLYNQTSCPGNIEQNVEKIKQIAKGYGCDFE